MKKQSKTENDLLNAVYKFVRYYGGYAMIAGPISFEKVGGIRYAIRVEFLGTPPNWEKDKKSNKRKEQ
jgi:hypothetical protein